jgi:DNA modification methylase
MKWTTDRVMDEFGLGAIDAMNVMSDTATSTTSTDPSHVESEVRRHVAAVKVKVVQGDCITKLGSIPSGTVDLVVADPPYNVGVDYGDGKKADRLADEAYIEWTRRWVLEVARVLRPGGAVCVICGQEYAGDHQVALRDAGLEWRNTITWFESFGANCVRKFNRTSRQLFYFVKPGAEFTFNRDEVLVPSDRQTKYDDKRAASGGKVMDDVWADVWAIPRVCGTHAERVPEVPTQLPLELVRRLVLTLSRPGDILVDPFAGSGTTGVVAAECGRKFLGIELRERFAEVARGRIATTNPTTGQ